MADRNTMQKEIIYQTLCQMRSHPSAAAVYDQVHLSHPTISRSTVYRVLAKMADEGKILRLDLAGAECRYDGELSPHCHVRCRVCGAVADLPPVAPPQPPFHSGFLLEDCYVMFRGLCPQCREKGGL